MFSRKSVHIRRSLISISHPRSRFKRRRRTLSQDERASEVGKRKWAPECPEVGLGRLALPDSFAQTRTLRIAIRTLENDHSFSTIGGMNVPLCSLDRDRARFNRHIQPQVG